MNLGYLVNLISSDSYIHMRRFMSMHCCHLVARILVRIHCFWDGSYLSNNSCCTNHCLKTWFLTRLKKKTMVFDNWFAEVETIMNRSILGLFVRWIFPHKPIPDIALENSAMPDKSGASFTLFRATWKPRWNLPFHASFHHWSGT